MDSDLNSRVIHLAAAMPVFRADLDSAVHDIESGDWKDALTSCRRLLEAMEKFILLKEFNEEPKPGKGDHLSKVLQKFPRELQPTVRFVRDMGNLGAHFQDNEEAVSSARIEQTLSTTCDLLEWYVDKYLRLPRQGTSGRPSGSAEAPLPLAAGPLRPDGRRPPSGADATAPQEVGQARAVSSAATPRRRSHRGLLMAVGVAVVGLGVVLVAHRHRVLPMPAPRASTLPKPPAPPPPPASPPDREWTRQPSGTSNGIHDIWGAGAALYAVGDRGTLLFTRDSGRRWEPLPSGTSADLYGVFGFPGGPVFAVGDHGTILCLPRGETAFQPCPRAQPTRELLYSVWGRGPTDIYAVGDHGVILRSADQGRAWSAKKVSGNALRRVSGGGSDEVWAVGWGGTLLKGPSWRALSIGTTAWIHDLWLSPTQGLFLVASDGATKKGVLLRMPREGGPATLLWRGNPLYTLWGRDAADLRVAGVGREVHRWDGIRVQAEAMDLTMPSGRPPTFKRLFGTDDGDMYLVGLGGVILHRQLSPPGATSLVAGGPAAVR